MSKFEKSFAGGNPLKAEELNQMAAAINDNDDQITSLREYTDTKINELDIKTQVYYVASKGSYIKGDSIHITSLAKISRNGHDASVYTFNQTYTKPFGGAYIFVFNTITHTCSFKEQSSIIISDDILLWGSSAGGFNATGKLIGLVLTEAQEYNIIAELIGEATFYTNGEIYNICDGTQNQWYFTSNYLKINGSSSVIFSIDGVLNDEDYYINQYDEDFGYISRLKNSVSLSKDCRYVKIGVKKKNAANHDCSRRRISLAISSEEEPTWIFNKSAESQTNPNYIFATYEVEMPIITDDTATPTSDYRGYNGTRVFNRGYIYLPVNYSQIGKPVKCVIYCNGTSGYDFNSDSLMYNNSFVQFMAKCGYAVIGCSTRTELYKDTSSTSGADGNLTHPISFACYQSLWNYMTMAYNIDKSGAYIVGLSSGGLMTLMISQMRTIPIKCAASLAGSVDIFSNMRICNGNLNNFWLNMLGMNYDNLPNGLSSSGLMEVVDSDVKNYVIANIDKFNGFNPFWFECDLNIVEFINEYFNTINYTSNLESNSTLVGMINASRLNFNTPLKIWHAVDDTNVPIAMSRFFAKMVKNAGGMCYLRELPSGVGAHHAVGVDTDEGYPVTDYITNFGETVNVAVAWAEVVDWFNRW